MISRIKNRFSAMAADLKNSDTIASANSELSSNLYNALKATSPDNLIYSPFSLSAVMAMVKVGAKGTTAEEMVKVMKYPQDDAILSAGYSKILKSIQANCNGCTLAMANRLYLDVKLLINDEFSKQIEKNFKAGIKQLDFRNSEESAKIINNFVETNTQGQIKNLISPEGLKESTRLVLVNAIYFKGLWQNSFAEDDTKEQPFYLNATEMVQNVPMMYKMKKVPYANLEECKAHCISLSYQGDRLCMIIIAPKEIKDGLAEIEKHLKAYTPQYLLGKMVVKNKVRIRLPRFKIESTIQFVPVLQDLGLVSLFHETADLRGIDSTGSIFVTNVIQKAFIEVDEKGSKAAAATTVVVYYALDSVSPEPTSPIDYFDADRPFVYQIVDKHTKLVLFAGKCTNPTFS